MTYYAVLDKYWHSISRVWQLCKNWIEKEERWEQEGHLGDQSKKRGRHDKNQTYHKPVEMERNQFNGKTVTLQG